MAFSLALLAFSYVNASAQSFSAELSAVALEREIQRKLNMLPYYEVFDHITYTVDGGVITLNGKVRNGVNKGDAAGAVKRIAGVEMVVNNIEILPAGSFDESIRRNLLHTVAGFGGLSRYLWPVNPSMRLVVERGHVTLEGYVASEGDSNLARMAALSVPGVFSVTNKLKVDSKRAG